MIYNKKFIHLDFVHNAGTEPLKLFGGDENGEVVSCYVNEVTLETLLGRGWLSAANPVTGGLELSTPLPPALWEGRGVGDCGQGFHQSYLRDEASLKTLGRGSGSVRLGELVPCWESGRLG